MTSTTSKPRISDRPQLGGHGQYELLLDVNDIVSATSTAAAANGWHNDYPQREDYKDGRQHFKAQTNWIVAKMALIMGEGSEAIEEIRNGHAATHTYYLDERPGSTTEGQLFDKQEWIDGVPQLKPEGVPSELADIIIRTGDLAGLLTMDLGIALVEKLHYNTTRGQRHGGRAL